ncbi:YpjP family protein [Planococcus sp. N028]|uniref:YpjP family protein n=1 Tax=Planococcus shixiaomingii TaxID=3058393 RepID=A0ABT8MZG6_9BACL|nr:MULTISPECIES: YpjP family protein [unclassified Planococcus (in: firmicutes)]MDN7241037.1 YpjP family protein [Planococcus sp. N028]WKA53291.1 YpjP family protein [Planococcus sp. N022]
MKNWWQKSLMIAVAVLTLGVISPNHTLWETLLDEKGSPKSHATESQNKDYTYEWVDLSEYYDTGKTVLDTFYQTSEEQAYVKFGSRIGPVIQDQFQAVILPNIQQAIDMHLGNLGAEQLNRLAISERPAGDYAEKIFHIYNRDTKKDEIRFHVRTEKKPQEGYFFNFHYHLAEDNYQKHYALGDIYWSKDTPPKWLS